MKKVSACLLGALPVVALALVPAPARAADDLKVGVRVSYFTEAEAASVGAELVTRIAHRVYFNPNVEYVFIDDGSYWTFNGDFHYDFPTHSNTYVWLGGGLAIVHVDPDGPAESDTDVGANFIGGVGFRTGSVIPYFQAKLIAKSDTEFAIAFGLRF
jgi:hypothetical protein